MHDEPHLKLSVLYFCESGHLFPEETQKVAARNLIRGCRWYDVEPPEALVKIAFLGLDKPTDGGSALPATAAALGSALGAAGRLHGLDQAILAGTLAGAVAAGTAKDGERPETAIRVGLGATAGGMLGGLAGAIGGAVLGRGRYSDEMTFAGGSLGSAIGSAVYAHRANKPPEVYMAEKQADLTNTEIMPKGALKNYVARKTTGKDGTPIKTSSYHGAAMAISERFIDDSWERSGDLRPFTGHTTVKEAQYEHFCLPHLRKYPIDSYELVKKADAYFCEHLHEIPLVERRVYAQNLAARADEIGVGMSEKVAAYTGDGYGPHIRAELVKRASAYAGTGREIGYEALLDRLNDVPPRVMAVLIKEADDKTGASAVYGREVNGFRDPYQAVFGKSASTSEYEWSAGGVRTTGSDLSKLAKTASIKLSEVFGAGFGESFAKDPTGIFESMPDPQKALIAKMANQA